MTLFMKVFGSEVRESAVIAEIKKYYYARVTSIASCGESR